MAKDQGKVNPLVDALRQHIRRTDATRLPPVSALAKHFGVGTRAVLAALAVLKAAGEVEYRKGQRVRIAGKPGPARPLPAPREPKALMESRRLEARIASGELKSGDPLPKVGYAARMRGLSNHTVIEAYRQLAARGLVRKRGRTYVIGARSFPARESDPAPAARPTLCILEPKDLYWEGLMAERTLTFHQTFGAEAQRHGIRLMVCPERGGSSGGLPLPTGLAQIRAAIAALGPRYLGALVVGTRERWTDLGRVISMLLVAGKPVAWFDQGGQGLDPPPGGARLWVRGAYSEAGAAEAAIAHLAAQGHAGIGFLRSSAAPWQVERERLLAESSGRRDGKVAFLSFSDSLERLREGGVEACARRLRRLAASPRPPVRKTLAFLIRELGRGCGGWKSPSAGFQVLARMLQAWAPQAGDASEHRWDTAYLASIFPHDLSPLDNLEEMLPLLLDERLTALILPSDRHAPQFCRKLSQMEIRVPRDLSLLSFDNSPGLMSMPLSTVDFGGADLGYRIFHALVRDLPVRRDRPGQIIGRAEVIDRGSVLPARRPSAPGSSATPQP